MKEQTVFALAALAAQDYVAANSSVQLDMDFRILKSDITCILMGITSLQGAGLILYMAEGDLDAAAVEVNIEQNGSVRLGQQAEEEIASRWVRRVVVSPNDTVNNTERAMLNEHGGALLTLTPRWTFRRARSATDGGWNWGIYNDGETITTGAMAWVLATHYGVWVT